MSAGCRYSAVETDAQCAGFARVLAHSFARTETETTQWLARHSRSDLRVLTEAPTGAVVAGLILIPMGQFFGGRSVPLQGVAGVGVAPEARGQGAAAELMRCTLREMHSAGVPISGLYPAAQKLYRGVGYEQAGSRMEVRIPPQSIGIRRSKQDGLSIRAMEPSDRPAVLALYAASARFSDGNLDRGPMAWDRIERPPPSRTDPARAFVIEGPAGLEAYIFLNQQMPVPPVGGKHEVHIHDMAASSTGSALALWSFLGGYASLATEIVWNAGPGHPLLALLNEQTYRMTLRHHWMLRITDVAAAVAARGFPAHARDTLPLRVGDSVIDANAGSWSLDVQNGAGAARRHAQHDRPPAAEISLDITALAALFAGFFSPWSLRLMGVLEGDEQSLQRAAAIFPVGSPWMTDMY